MKTYLINSNDGAVHGAVTLGHVISMGAIDVRIGDSYYRVVIETNEVRVSVAVKGWPRKVKSHGTTGRKVIARALFPQAA